VDRRGQRTDRSARLDGPPDVSLGDRRLIEWVAGAAVGDPFPEPWSYCANPITAIMRTLIALDVVERPAPGTDLATIARDAAASARAWLEANPPRPRPGATAC